ncbi:hypothetical protein CMI43_01125 [Candidatus Pacearchaeota archaeon]|nr:hypothetical protein [Candidatus Pacearchaeota archaeon]|tara:strand:+ start:32 stop:1312 length:1281 start_codon:yes stop_codon:yes gene_type:complete
MKKSVLSISLIILLLPTFLAIEITFSKDIYQPQELFQAQITGNFLSLTENNLFIYKDGKAHPEPTLKGVTKQNNIYHFYAILPNEPGNYSLRIQDTDYLVRGVLNSETIIQPISIILEDESDLYINPGFIIPKDDFSIKVKSLFGNTDLTAIFEATGEEKILSLTEQVEETLNFNLPELIPQQSKITINSYEIPVFLIKKLNNTISDLEFIPHLIEGTITPNNDYQFSILIKNPTNRNLENITLNSDLTTAFSPSTIELLEPNQTIFVNLTITVEQVEDNLNGQITASIEEDEFYLPVSFIITNNDTEIKVNDATNIPTTGTGSSALSCSQLGVICLIDQTCSGDTIESIEGPCCIGTCIEEEPGTGSTIIGIVLIIILILLIAYIVWKARRKKNLKSPEQILEDKKVKYKKRMKGEKVSGKLDSV